MNGANPSTLFGSSPPAGILAGRVRSLRRSLPALSFWGAIALPSIYLPLLFAGIDTANGLLAFFVLFGLHVFALIGGRRYRRAAKR